MVKADELVGLYVARGLKLEPAPQSGHSVAHVQEVCALEETARELIVKAWVLDCGEAGILTMNRFITHTQKCQRRANMISLLLV